MNLILPLIIMSGATIDETVTSFGYNQAVVREAVDFYSTLDFNKLKKLDFRERLKTFSRMIKKRIKVQKMICDTGGYFELDAVLQNQKGNCLGLTQLFYIYGKAQGLKVQGIIGKNHIADLVAVDSLFYLVDLAAQPDPYISEPFIFEKIFKPINDNYYQLSNKKFLPSVEMRKIYKQVQLLNEDGVIAALYFNRGLVATYREKFPTALNYFDKAISLNPRFAEAYANKGKILLLQDKNHEALKALTRAVEFNPTIASAYADRAIINLRLGALNNAIEDCNQAIRLDVEMTEAYITRGNVQLRKKQYHTAVLDYDTALKFDPGRYEIYLNRGIAYSAIGNYKKAINNFNQALALNPDLFEGYLNRAEVYHQLKNYDDAITDYDKAIKIKPESWIAYFNRGNSYFQLRNYESALADFQRTIDLNPSLAEAYLNRGIIYYNLRKMNKAREDFEKVHQLNQAVFLEFYNDIKRHGKGYLFMMLKKITSDSGDNSARNGFQP